MVRATWRDAFARRPLPYLLWLCACAATLLPPLREEATVAAFLCFVVMLIRVRRDDETMYSRAMSCLQRKRFKRGLARPGRVVVSLAEPRLGVWKAIAVGFAGWLVALLVATACVNMQTTLALGVGVSVLTMLAFVLHRLTFGGATRDVATLGYDGVSIGPDFVPHARIEAVLSSLDTHVIVRARGADGRTQAFDARCAEATPEVCEEIERRRAAWLADTATRELAGPRAEDTEEHAAGMREAAVPRAELVRTLRDGTAPLDERVRVAEVLATHAPEEVELLAEETADDELRAALARKL